MIDGADSIGGRILKKKILHTSYFMRQSYLGPDESATHAPMVDPSQSSSSGGLGKTKLNVELRHFFMSGNMIGFGHLVG